MDDDNMRQLNKMKPLIGCKVIDAWTASKVASSWQIKVGETDERTDGSIDRH